MSPFITVDGHEALVRWNPSEKLFVGRFLEGEHAGLMFRAPRTDQVEAAAKAALASAKGGQSNQA
ncbi:hypothetical protein E3E12_02625 [Formicincola oecophyllae]|uniref:Uncharacterized protein n=1 Tax=Formicincola oecophyllae TaxID=2558361 RepID=A0A4Y6U7B7_9PROT|nr:hypothetical protein [Formicincola oecophyllae]QDH13279.1 hypothetical protein E3E12_02625 [Formicincola oecophyllae]